MSQLYLLPAVVHWRLWNILIIPPAISKPKLSVDEIVKSPQPIPDVYTFSSEIVLKIIRIFNVFQVKHDLRVTLWTSWKVIFVEKWVECAWIFNASVRVVGCLLTLSIHFVHQCFCPFVVSKGSWHFFGKSGQLPINIALFPNFIHILRNKPVISFGIYFLAIETN